MPALRSGISPSIPPAAGSVLVQMWGTPKRRREPFFVKTRVAFLLTLRYIRAAQAPTSLTNTEALTYLRGERLCLDEQLRSLHREFEALRNAHFPQQAFAEHRQRMQAYWALVANHFIAVEWTFHPPCGRANRSSRFVSVPTQTPCALAAAQQTETEDLKVGLAPNTNNRGCGAVELERAQ
jgi:hypothetical protein